MKARRLAATAAIVVPALVLGCGGDEGPPGVNLPQDMSADGYYTPTPIECPDGEPQLVDGRPATWTVIHYAAGDNDLEDNILTDINEMELGMNNGSPNVRVVVQLDRKAEDGVWRYEIKPDSVANDPERNQLVSRLVGYSQEEPNSGDYRTLIEFGRWAAFCYPADNYIVIIGGHGRGWSVSSNDGSEDPVATDPEGTVAFDDGREARSLAVGDGTRFIAPDDSDGSEIYISQLVTALNAIREITRRPEDPRGLNRLVLYGSDACLMGTIEVAYDLRTAVRYLVGSEQKEPDHGWPYSTILRALNERPSMYATDPEALAAEFVDAYERSYGPNGAAGEVSTSFTLSAINTEHTIRARDRMRTIAESLTGLLADLDEDGERLAAHLEAARSTSPTFGETYIDLGVFLDDLMTRLVNDGLMPAEGEFWDGDQRFLDLRLAIDDLLFGMWGDMVLAAANGDDYHRLWGLSVYYPEDECNLRLPLAEYGESTFAQRTGWHDAVSSILFRDIREAHGTGATDYTVDDVPLDAVTVDCHIGNNDLFVVVNRNAEPISLEGQSVPFPAISMAFTPVSGGGLRLTSAQVDARESFGFRVESRNLAIDAERASVMPGVMYGGAVTIPFESSGETHIVSADFYCAAFELACR